MPIGHELETQMPQYAPTIELKRTVLQVGPEKVDFVSCAELGLYLCYKDARLTYRLIEPTARLLMWTNKGINACPQTLDCDILRDKGTMLVAFESMGGRPNLDPLINSLEKQMMVAESDVSERFAVVPYADDHPGEEVFNMDIIEQIKREDPEFKHG